MILFECMYVPLDVFVKSLSIGAWVCVFLSTIPCPCITVLFSCKKTSESCHADYALDHDVLKLITKKKKNRPLDRVMLFRVNRWFTISRHVRALPYSLGLVSLGCHVRALPYSLGLVSLGCWTLMHLY